jgi:hypothetical protein
MTSISTHFLFFSPFLAKRQETATLMGRPGPGWEPSQCVATSCPGYPVNFRVACDGILGGGYAQEATSER